MKEEQPTIGELANMGREKLAALWDKKRADHLAKGGAKGGIQTNDGREFYPQRHQK